LHLVTVEKAAYIVVVLANFLEGVNLSRIGVPNYLPYSIEDYLEKNKV
jgi:hypothetical protein